MTQPSRHAIGSAAWANEVFESPPVRVDVLKRKDLHRTAPLIRGRKRHLAGGLPVVAAYLIDFLVSRGVVARWKEYPFFWPAGSPHLARSSPHFMAELKDGELVLVRIKATHYMTATAATDFEWERQACEQAGMTYLLWSEKHPLTRACRDLHFRLRSAVENPHDPEALEGVVDLVSSRGPMTAGAIADAGLDTTTLPAAIATGRLHINIQDCLHERTLISSKPVIDLRSYFLGSRFDPENWWNSLPSGRAG